MKAWFFIPLLTAAAAFFGLPTSQRSVQAQSCDFGYGFHGGGGSFGYGGSRGFSLYFGNRGYRDDYRPSFRSRRFHYDRGCDFYSPPVRYYEFRIQRRLPRDLHALDCECETCLDIRRRSAPVTAPKRITPEADTGKGIIDDDTIPFRNAPVDNSAPKKKPGYLDLPDPAPRQDRKSNAAPREKESAPLIEKAPLSTEKVGLFDRFKRKKQAANASALVKDSFPLDVAVTDSNGNRTSLRQVIGNNKAVLVDFWAEWCGPCIQGMPVLKQRAAGLAQHGIVVAGMNVDSDQKAASRVRDRFKMNNVAWLVEPKSQDFSTTYKIRSIPFMLLIDRNGDVLFQGHPHDQKLEKALDDLTTKTLALR